MTQVQLQWNKVLERYIGTTKTYTVRSFYELSCNFIFFHFMYIEHIIIINKIDVLKIVLKLLVVMCCGMQCYIQQQTRKKSQTS